MLRSRDAKNRQQHLGTHKDALVEADSVVRDIWLHLWQHQSLKNNLFHFSESGLRAPCQKPNRAHQSSKKLLLSLSESVLGLLSIWVNQVCVRIGFRVSTTWASGVWRSLHFEWNGFSFSIWANQVSESVSESQSMSTSEFEEASTLWVIGSVSVSESTSVSESVSRSQSMSIRSLVLLHLWVSRCFSFSIWANQCVRITSRVSIHEHIRVGRSSYILSESVQFQYLSWTSVSESTCLNPWAISESEEVSTSLWAGFSFSIWAQSSGSESVSESQSIMPSESEETRFLEWVCSRIPTVSTLMVERSHILSESVSVSVPEPYQVYLELLSATLSVVSVSESESVSTSGVIKCVGIGISFDIRVNKCIGISFNIWVNRVSEPLLTFESTSEAAYRKRTKTAVPSCHGRR